MKIERTNHILDHKDKTIEHISLLHNPSVVKRITDALEVIAKILLPNDLPINKVINGVVKSTVDNHLTIGTEHGIVRIAPPDNISVNQNFIINQNISVGLYDIPDRNEFLKIEISVPGASPIEEQIYQFLVKKDNIYHQLLDNEDVVEINHKNINQKLYQLVAIDDSGKKVNINLELHSNGVDKAFLKGSNIYLTINDRLYRVIGEVHNLKNILTSGPQNISLVISEEFNLKESFIHLLDKIPQSLPIKSLVEIASLFTQSSSNTTPPLNYLEAYKSVLFPIFSQFRHARLRIRESRSSCITLRFIFELESEDGYLNIIDCLYRSSTNSLNIIVRSDSHLSPESKARFTAAFNRIASAVSFKISISFVVQSHEVLRQLLSSTDHNSHNEIYTYSV